MGKYVKNTPSIYVKVDDEDPIQQLFMDKLKKCGWAEWGEIEADDPNYSDGRKMKLRFFTGPERWQKQKELTAISEPPRSIGHYDLENLEAFKKANETSGIHVGINVIEDRIYLYADTKQDLTHWWREAAKHGWKDPLKKGGNKDGE